MGTKSPFELPLPFRERMIFQLKEEFPEFESSLSEPSQVSVRINPEKWKVALPADPVPWCGTGFYLPSRPLFTADPWLHGGAYYVQEASSMFLEQLFLNIRPDSPALVLDLCGAPGGKTTHLMSMLREGDILVTNEVIRSRAAILAENVTKWGVPGVVVTNGDPAGFSKSGEIFDIVVVDAPCSGEGLFRKEPRAVAEWSLQNTTLCASRQKRILAEAWKCLKPGGALIYSTCTYNSGENEENVEWLLREKSALQVEVAPDREWNIAVSRKGMMTGYRFYPHRLRGEGFFAAVVRKTGSGGASLSGKRGPGNLMPATRKGKISPGNFLPVTRKESAGLNGWLVSGSGEELLSDGRIVTWFPRRGWPLLGMLEKNMHVVRAGTPVAAISGNGFNPHPGFAFSTLINRDYFPEAPLSHEEAIRFLRKEPLHISGGEKGWMLTSFRDLPLGWLKNLGERSNNYYPVEYRIRMSFENIPPLWHDVYSRPRH